MANIRQFMKQIKNQLCVMFHFIFKLDLFSKLRNSMQCLFLFFVNKIRIRLFIGNFRVCCFYSHRPIIGK